MARILLGKVFYSWAPRNARQPLPNLVQTGGWRRPMVELNLVGPADEGTRKACRSELACPFRDLQTRTMNFCLNISDTLYASNFSRRVRAEV